MQKKEAPEVVQHDYECTICYARSNSLVRCQGPCQKMFCSKCAAYAKCTDDRCPYRCSSPFVVELLQLPFRCPFRPHECTVEIKGLKEEERHYLICPFVSVQEKNAIDNQNNYRCKEGHKLTFLPEEGLILLYGRNWVTIGQKDCSSCGNHALCRSICLSCSTKKKYQHYCHHCRIPPCTKTRCPLGHRMKKIKPRMGLICDLCDLPSGRLRNSTKVYGSCNCDFDICEVCASRLLKNHRRTRPLEWKTDMLNNIIERDLREQNKD